MDEVAKGVSPSFTLPQHPLRPPAPGSESLLHCTEPCAVSSSKIKLGFSRSPCQTVVTSLWP